MSMVAAANTIANLSSTEISGDANNSTGIKAALDKIYDLNSDIDTRANLLQSVTSNGGADLNINSMLELQDLQGRISGDSEFLASVIGACKKDIDQLTTQIQ